MKAALRTLRQQPCRSHEVTENEKRTFENYPYLQRYHPAIERFPVPDFVSCQTHAALSSTYYIDTWLSKEETHSKIWNTLRTNLQGDKEESKTFVKVVHLLDPIDVIKDKYTCPVHPLLPQSGSSWKDTLMKLQSYNNQAYVDNVANFVLSRFRERNVTPNCILYYGSSSGISTSYPFNISNEFSTYRQCRWFWKGMKAKGARLSVSKPETDIENTNFDEIYKEITTCPFNEEDEEDTEDIEDIELEPLFSDSSLDTSDMESVCSVPFDVIQHDVDRVDNVDRAEEVVTIHKRVHKKTESSNESDGSDDADDSDGDSVDSADSADSDETVELDLDISIDMPNMPVLLIYQEAQEGVIDDLLDEEELDGHERGSQGWEARWIAWLFQVIAVLSFLQKAISFTHNDLHSNNIVWRKTAQKFLYYRNKQGTIWRVPTFGKIISIIDFGRSIFRLGSHLWISDDHWPNQDAGDQYNFGPFFDPSKPKNPPNPSFDLSRLSVSLIDGLFDETPHKKKGKKIQVMSEEGSWKVYETSSPLYNLLWSWTVDDAGRTIYVDKHGNDKYEGFDLYIRIAHDVHNAVPSEQIHKPIFEQFKWKAKVDKKETIYSLGC